MDKVILVNEADQAIGEMEKLEAHEKGLLHRAFSVFIFNSKGEMLLQQRAKNKYHSAGLWTNTCCSHPMPMEDTMAAAKRRLMEEMGLAAELVHKDFLVYKAEFQNGLTEHEYDHIFTGMTDAEPVINKSEVERYKWLSVEKIKQDILQHPEIYTYWFKKSVERFF